MEQDQSRYLTVQALTKYIKRKFDKDPHLSNLFVRGEISNFKQHSSGHMYFTLKDDRARILSVMFSSHNQQLKFRPESGMNVLIRGDISVYEAGGQYQIYVKEMQPDGIGELYLAYEQLKEKLDKAGYFDQARKRMIPKFPSRIAVVTSPTGAAIRDIITTIKRRYPIGEILIFPALVQGERAAGSIAGAIKKANETKGIDVLITGRGGGSIEELWAFNEEIVARAIVESRIPVISAVGHETDFTIADFVADLRAPTPTAAGELAVPHIDDLLERIMNRKLRMIKSFKAKLQSERNRLNGLTKSYALRNPHTLYQQKVEHVDRLTEQLQRNISLNISRQRDSLKVLVSRLERVHPSFTLKIQQDRVKFLREQVEKEFKGVLKDKANKFQSIISTLDALSPLKVMERGYSLVYGPNGELVKSSQQVSRGDKLEIGVKDGAIICEVDTIKERIDNGKDE
ncbi:exodeoxyribonuclease VII large subunit [Rossellomorea aquimaris]|uniref:exodeoxyribonuclease VII large subunit n=1 Tax=Rossellomorea aquimaris TaxID=189382 RepID=UPI001CD422AE|nr:exodeoxyribonuclease VII large subunit [Rossellomorea aquimaris]MCA1054776.1 exodeoxyribonuclease VII large subunit [Rossellomorea aquimaris]